MILDKMSIVGLNNWTNGRIWDAFDVPDGLDRQDVIDSIMLECADLSLVYTEPELVTLQIGLWCRKNMENWTRILQALTEVYDPLHNYDRHENWTDTSNTNGSTKVAGFNLSAGMADRDSAHSDGSGTHQGHIYGNIGVTTAAQMIQGEMDVRVRYNTIDVIVDSFKREMCVMLY